MVYVKIVNKRKFTYIIEARLNASAGSCLKCKPVQQVCKGDSNVKSLAIIIIINNNNKIFI